MSILNSARRQRPRAHRANQHQAGTLGPDAVEVRARTVGLAEGVCASFAITGYPAEVGPGWLEPLLTYPGRLEVAVHIEPTPPTVAADRLRRQLARLESTARSDAEHGRLEDFQATAAADDARDLAAALARGQTRLFRVGLYLTVHAPDEDALEAECSQVRALASSLLLDAAPATFRTLQGFTTTLPLGVDSLNMRRTFDTQALAAAFPFTSPDMDVPITDTTVLYGINTNSSSLVLWDRWAQDNHNSVILARSGAGKSYLTKLDVLRSLYGGVEVAVIDPEDEYARLCRAVGGSYISLGSSGVKLNPFDLPTGVQPGTDAFTRRALFLHTLIGVLLDEPLDPSSKAALDRAIVEVYASKGITTDPRTWSRPAPLLADLAATLGNDTEDPKAAEVAARLAPYVTGTHRHLFDAATTTHPEGHLVVFSLRDLPDELRAAGTLLALDAVWRRVSNPRDRRRRLVVVDEAWLLMREPDGARFLFRLAKSARKYWCALAVVTQDTADLLGSDLGQAVVANSATQILLRQAPQAIDAVGDAFNLSAGERQFLVGCPRGEGLMVAGSQRVSFQAIASPAEHQVATSSPAELAEITEVARDSQQKRATNAAITTDVDDLEVDP
ncbi:conjugal transfer protein TraC [Actinomadura sp. KC06]|uniref:VirB4 family type IV secretion system protein n=1 Tax=Actinomadura sp. KC06 TaxID=2530369 RepID=UPI001A9F6FA8|nr:conjugal transfer protein TraC [Actinomadura sp. KC06]